MNKDFVIRYLLYLFRWQCSTPILWIVLVVMQNYFTDNTLLGTIIANLIGGCMFFFIDRIIFNYKKK